VRLDVTALVTLPRSRVKSRSLEYHGSGYQPPPPPPPPPPPDDPLPEEPLLEPGAVEAEEIAEATALPR
jgi:hypothetical protein